MVAVSEMFIIGVGKIVTKQLLKVWIDDDSLSDPMGSFVDLLPTKISTPIDRKRLARKFEDFGDVFASSISGSLEEFNLTKLEHDLVKSCLDESLFLAKINNQLLSKLDYNYSLLEKHINLIDSASKRELYGKSHDCFGLIVRQISKCIIDVSSTLPNFSEASIGEILTRNSNIIGQCEEIISSVQEIKTILNDTNESRQVEVFESNYLSAVASRYSIIELYGADLQQDNKNKNLNIAYISLNVRCDKSGSDNVLAESILKSKKNILVTGLAGSGKTTFLQWIAVKAATKSFRGELAYVNNCIPFFIKLREVNLDKLPTPSDFISYSVSSQGNDYASWVREKLIAGNAIVLIDGVDELPVEYRNEVRLWLSELVSTYQKSHFVVTSRPTAIQEGWLSAAGFMQAEIQDMDNQHIDEFIEHWHRAIVIKDLDSVSELSSSLKARIRDSKPLKNLAITPLLCAMICALHKERNQQLPKDKIQLYEACIEMLLERRNVERKISNDGYPNISSRQKKVILQELAYWLQINNLTSASFAKVEEKIKFITQHMDIPDSEKSILRLFLDRSGIIREPSNGNIDFTHKTFQEYFSAIAIKEKGDVGYLASVAKNDQWYETIMLSAGLFSENQIEEFIDKILSEETGEDANYLQLVALACLESCLRISIETRERIQGNISKLIPPNNFREAKALSSAGDLAAKYITNVSKLKVNQSKSCIRTLSLIGSEVAFNKIIKFKKDTRKTVTYELLRAWESFDSYDYAEKILAYQYRNIKTLAINSKEQIKCLKFFKQVEFLEIRYSINDEDLFEINQLEFLKFFEIGNAENIKNFSCVKNKSVEILIVSNIKDDSLEGVENLSSLKELILFCDEQISLAGLAGCGSLKQLVVLNCYSVDLSPLCSCESLLGLMIADYREIVSSNDIRSVKNLKISYSNNQIISGIQIFPSLEMLEVDSHKNLTDIDCFSSLRKLKSLSVINSGSNFDVSAILDLLELKKVYIPELDFNDPEAWKDIAEEQRDNNFDEQAMNSMALAFSRDFELYDKNSISRSEFIDRTSWQPIDDFLEIY